MSCCSILLPQTLEDAFPVAGIRARVLVSPGVFISGCTNTCQCPSIIRAAQPWLFSLWIPSRSSHFRFGYVPSYFRPQGPAFQFQSWSYGD
ncbi:hypothetical protein PM082_014144 [Marasmius tenuissimus]|nr:hypothetical protein PM082_014144 [Marasmius tenuissimus]